MRRALSLALRSTPRHRGAGGNSELALTKASAAAQATSSSIAAARAASSLASSTSTSAPFSSLFAPPRLRSPSSPSSPSSSLHQQRRSMFVQTQSTPNPASLMFIPGEAVLPPGAGGVTFSSARDARAGSPSSPLASAIFRVEGVAAVFFGSDFITVTKKEESSWELVKPGVFEAVMEHYASGRPVLGEGAPSSAAASASAEPHRAPDTAPHEDDSETVAMIKELIETRVRPAVQEDGGDIEFVSFDESDGAVVVRMRGACSGCPSSAVTLKSGIENMLMHYVPEVTSVEEAEPDEAQNEGARAFSALEKHLST